jgi:hypothetical protein
MGRGGKGGMVWRRGSSTREVLEGVSSIIRAREVP